MTTDPQPDAVAQILQGLALHWEQLATMAKAGPAAGMNRCAGDLYDVVGVPGRRMDVCVCGRHRFQHAPHEDVVLPEGAC